MINKMLKDRIYVGDLIQGKKKVKNYRSHKLIATKKDENSYHKINLNCVIWIYGNAPSNPYK